MQYLLNSTSLGPALFSNDNNFGGADNENSRINLVIHNTKIIDRFLFQEAITISERMPTLNSGLKVSNELAFFKVFQNTMY